MQGQTVPKSRATKAGHGSGTRCKRQTSRRGNFDSDGDACEVEGHHSEVDMDYPDEEEDATASEEGCRMQPTSGEENQPQAPVKLRTREAQEAIDDITKRLRGSPLSSPLKPAHKHARVDSFTVNDTMSS